MKKLLLLAGALLAPSLAAAFPIPIRYVQISTTPITSRQIGISKTQGIDVSSATISSCTIVNQTVSSSTVTNQTVNSSTATSINVATFIPSLAIASMTVTNFTASLATFTVVNVSTITPGMIRGTTVGNNATAGSYGEYVSSVAASVPPGASGVYINIASVSLTAGDWDVSGHGVFTSATTGTGSNNLALSLFSGNTTTDQVVGDNQAYLPTNSTGFSLGGSIPAWRVSVNSTTIVYLKGALIYSVVGPAVWYGRISARRVR